MVKFEEIERRAAEFGVIILEKERRDYFVRALPSHYQSLITDYIFINDADWDTISYSKLKAMVKTRWDRAAGFNLEEGVVFRDKREKGGERKHKAATHIFVPHIQIG